MVLPDLKSSDLHWLARRVFLETSGYRLRPKFQPDYVPDPDASWYEERATHTRGAIMDATRISDERPVILKSVSTRMHPHEVKIARLFSSPPLAENPRNHCVPIFDVLQDPEDADKQIIVMPRLIEMDRPLFETVGEVVDCFRQIFEGVEFMHDNFVAHRDCWGPNIAQDPTLLFPWGFHPVYTTQDPANLRPASHIARTFCWPRYFIIDFGLSRRYDPFGGPPLEPVIRGGDRSPPEHHKHPLVCNPFPTDIYFLGNFLKQDFLLSRWAGKKRMPVPSLRFLEGLINDMTQEDPSLRPTIGEVIERFDVLCSSLTQWHLRRPGQKYAFHLGLFFSQVNRTLRCIPPIPRYQPRMDRVPLSQLMREFFTQTPSVMK
ncbi:Protein kinase domain-containing protein [Mycena indigotica]|uniref:Protein kinase domain-containing protein n=1 Tax=Mycena indigotica TaxID=2126181 RepID=A0A8H6T7U5_9AGAR|nr:Protein kinase domain-containing protein [Mycena indigotica]KAF7312510.1 Protein kinase domain-containing protein [Mycena indigotica]